MLRSEWEKNADFWLSQRSEDQRSLSTYAEVIYWRRRAWVFGLLAVVQGIVLVLIVMANR
ncbi:MAG TPA: hypothetical protein VGH38_10200 [Bryobacteraceae bacterium]|jgi:hypothetical protein